MKNYTIRAATAADADVIKRMVRGERLDPGAVDWRYFMVLEIVEDGKPKIVGIGMARPEGDGAFYEIDSVTTLAAYRGRGYAEAVVRALMARTPHPLYLLSETDLVGYYERFGFKIVSPEAAPPAMREQARFVNGMFGGRVMYHVMGLGQ